MPTSKVAKMPSREQERAEAIRLYTDTRLPVDEIGAMFGVSRTTVHNWLKSAGIPQRGAMGPRKTLEERDEIAHELTAGSAERAVPKGEHAQILNLVNEVLRQQDEILHAMARLEGSLSTLVSIATGLGNR